MNPTDFKIARLMALYLSENLTEQQQQELTAWRKVSEKNERLFQRTIHPDNIAEYVEQHEQVDVPKQWQQFAERRNKRAHRKWWHTLGKAAAILILPLTILSVHFYLKPANRRIDVPQNWVTSHIQPGGTQAILKLADTDSTIYLTQQNALQLDEDNSILKSTNPTQQATDVNCNPMNTIEIPRGGEYTVTLPDGTVVYLNSMSKLIFPTHFDKNERRVHLEGEAFFDVSSSDVPFYVTTAQADIAVLGTTFNVSAYENERYEATLLTGKIALNSTTGKHVLKPYQMASIEHNSTDIKVEEVDALSISEWHKGRIVFQNESLEHIMTRLARWYDFEVVYENPTVAQLRFSCAVDKYNEIEPFIKLLKTTKRVQATLIDGKTIYLK